MKISYDVANRNQFVYRCILNQLRYLSVERQTNYRDHLIIDITDYLGSVIKVQFL